MTQNDLTSTIKYLIPDANFSVWDCVIDEYHGENEPINLLGFLVCWNSSNTSSCPTEAEINAVSQDAVAADVESKRKALRDEKYSADLSVLASYNTYRAINSDKTFSQYLDYLESLSIS